MLGDAGPSTQPIYLGVDVAGGKNTWVTALSVTGNSLETVLAPRLATLEEVFGFCEKQNVVAVVIDAQLTIALSEESGFRTSDVHLRSLLPADCRNWVASINSLMAVPIRGQLLADTLSPTVGTILETHPRASLYFGLEQSDEIATAIRNYKKGPDTRVHIEALWQAWSARYRLKARDMPQSDGALDALVCATVAYLFHHSPEKLLRLRHEVAHKTGRGPFYVLAQSSV